VVERRIVGMGNGRGSGNIFLGRKEGRSHGGKNEDIYELELVSSVEEGE